MDADAPPFGAPSLSAWRCPPCKGPGVGDSPSSRHRHSLRARSVLANLPRLRQERLVLGTNSCSHDCGLCASWTFFAPGHQRNRLSSGRLGRATIKFDGRQHYDGREHGLTPTRWEETLIQETAQGGLRTRRPSWVKLRRTQSGTAEIREPGALTAQAALRKF